MKKALFIFSTILIGSIFNFGHAYTFLIRYNLMVMLFFAFIGTSFDFKIFKTPHYKILAINLLTPILLYLILKQLHLPLAELIFVLTIVPTAAAVPVVAEMLNADIGITTGSLLLTTPLIALALPFLLTSLLGIGGDISVIELVLPIFSLVFIPMFLSQLIRKILPKLGQQLTKFGFISFLLFLLNIFIACGNASNFIQQNMADVGGQLFWIAGVTILVCLVNFRVGRFVGRKENPLAYELALGRKNTMIGLWLALTYFSPMIALGPICYIICHNTYNSYQMWEAERNIIK